MIWKWNESLATNADGVTHPPLEPFALGSPPLAFHPMLAFLFWTLVHLPPIDERYQPTMDNQWWDPIPVWGCVVPHAVKAGNVIHKGDDWWCSDIHYCEGNLSLITQGDGTCGNAVRGNDNSVNLSGKSDVCSGAIECIGWREDPSDSVIKW